MLNNNPSSSSSVFLFLFLSLFLGSICTYIISRYFQILPYTVVVFVLGGLLSLSLLGYSHDQLYYSETLWSNIDPELMLYIFLPALLFGETMRLNFYHVSESAVSSLLLAIPGAAFGAFFVAIIAKYSIPYLWSWELCLLLGSITCATDPIAIVSLLKRSGASTRLTYTIIGESLLNDGTALILYTLIYSLLSTEREILSATNIIIYFVKVIFISPVVGVIFGLVSVLLIGLADQRMKDDDTTVQMAITLCCAYLSFYVSEIAFEVSGVISCYLAGLMLARFAKPLLLKYDAIQSVWTTFEWIGNTLIFMLSGLIIGVQVIEQGITAFDLGCILLLYVIVMLARAIMVSFCYGIMSISGKHWSRSEALFIIWAGLRGSVSLALALSFLRSTNKGYTAISNSDARRFFFLVSGTSVATLLINATTSSALLYKLGLVSDSLLDSETLIIFQYINKRIRLKALILIEKLQKKYPRYINPRVVIQHCSILKRELNEIESIEITPKRIEEYSTMLHEIEPMGLKISQEQTQIQPSAYSPGAYSRSYDELIKEKQSHINLIFASQNKNSHEDSFTQIKKQKDCAPNKQDKFSDFQRECNAKLLTNIRRAFLDIIRVNYWQQLNQGRLPRKSNIVLLLLNSVERGQENTSEAGLKDWDFIWDKSQQLYEEIQRENIFEISLWEQSSPRSLLEYKEAQIVYMLTAFIEAHQYAQRKLPFYLGETDSVDTPEEVAVIYESEALVTKAQNKLSAINPEVVSRQLSRQMARWILHMQEDEIELCRVEGILIDKEAEILLQNVQLDLNLITRKYEWVEIIIKDFCLKIYKAFRCTKQSSTNPDMNHNNSEELKFTSTIEI